MFKTFNVAALPVVTPRPLKHGARGVSQHVPTRLVEKSLARSG
jgi:hypothetical protein